jgi:hypothetical protein
MYADIFKTSEGARKAWLTRAKNKPSDDKMKEALAKKPKIKVSGSVYSQVDNAASSRMQSSPNQADRDAYWRANGHKDEASAIRGNLKHYVSRGFMEASDAKGAMAQIGTKNQYQLAINLFGLKPAKAKVKKSYNSLGACTDKSVAGKSKRTLKEDSLAATTGVNVVR